jgi:hypothetical protein
MQGRQGQVTMQISSTAQDDDFTLNIQRNLSLLLKSEVNSPMNSNRDEEDDVEVGPEYQEIEQRLFDSFGDGASSNNSDESGDCNSRCGSPCQNPGHIEARVLSEIVSKAFRDMSKFSKREEGLLNKLVSASKPKSMISMFIQAQKEKEAKDEEETVHTESSTNSKLDVNKYFVPTSLI